MATRRGVLLVELLVAIALGGVVLGLLLRGIVEAARVMEWIALRVETQEAVRTVWVLLDEEVGAGLPQRDWEVTSDGVLALRGFRGFARSCDGESGAGGGLQVAWRGVRAPDPARDSLLVLGDDGGWRPAPLPGFRSGGGCAEHPGERGGEVELPPGVGGEGPILLRYFERGHYSIEGGALRYRRGNGGRQPLTLERFGPDSRVRRVGDGVEVHLEVVEPTAGRRGAPPRRLTWEIGGAGGGVP